jgi:HPt (histidine-containing phosphotransfer) domain-containing protein
MDAAASEPSALADMAHRLSGCAGMLGFQRVASLCRRFERAVQSKAADVAALGEGLAMAIADTCDVARSRGPV